MYVCCVNARHAILAEKLIRPKLVASFKADQVEPRLKSSTSTCMYAHFSKKVKSIHFHIHEKEKKSSWRVKCFCVLYCCVFNLLTTSSS